MLALSESVVIMDQRVMVHLYHRILNHSGHKSVQQSVKADANVIQDTTVIQIAVPVFKCTNVPIMVVVAKTNTGMNVEVTVKKINVPIY
jgi:hypothetical protein